MLPPNHRSPAKKYMRLEFTISEMGGGGGIRGRRIIQDGSWISTSLEPRFVYGSPTHV